MLAKETVYQEEIKKSRFIARAVPVDRVADGFASLDRIRQERATHHCWAYRIGQDYRFSDDGEPAGTAGKPILNAIERQDIDKVMVIVIRYYGGIKLGAGGLARAYGGCAAKCLQAASLKPVIALTEIRLRVEFADIGTLYPVIDRLGAEKIEERYEQNGLLIKLRIDREKCQAMRVSLKDSTSGRIVFKED